MSSRTVSVLVRGRVQGVWFRASTKHQADSLGITGWVKNLPDGNVYIEASGVPIQLEHFINWCRRGPDLARVDSIEVQELPVIAFSTFEIKRS